MEKPSPEPLESIWRKAPADRTTLRGQPELEQQARLTAALARLQDAPVPSNFTVRVMDAIELEEKRTARSQRGNWNWHWLLPRLAGATALLLVTGLGILHYETGRQHREITRNLSQLASTQAIPSVDALENLEAIQRMSQPTHADTELLAALQ